MANIQINIVENGTTTLATSGCICDRNIDINVDVPTTGGGGEGNREDFVPDSALTFSGDCNYTFSYDKWTWFLDKYADDITTQDLEDTDYMFYNCKYDKDCPIEFNFKNGGGNINFMFGLTNFKSVPSIDFKHNTTRNCSSVFQASNSLESIGTMKNLFPNSMDDMFYMCINLRYLPKFENINMNRMYNYASANMDGMFNKCCSLRHIDEDTLKILHNDLVSGYYSSVYYNMFNDCHALDEIVGLSPKITATCTNNLFQNTFYRCYRLKDIIFDVQEDGSPYTVSWKNQTIDLTTVGHMPNGSYIRQYNSGITEDKMANDDAAYQALKNDPDWWTTYSTYSRYNKESAWRTIQSLPDASAYLATAGGTNTIKFLSNSGYHTDGGQIHDLTEEQIAVAAAKGWTVSFTGTPMGGDIGGGVLPS